MAIKEFTVPGRGIGKADYSRTVSSAIERAGLVLKYDESLKIGGLVCCSPGVSPFPWVRPPLGAGEETGAIDFETGLDDLLIPAGYMGFQLDFDLSAGCDLETELLFDGYPVALQAILAGGHKTYQNWVVTYNTGAIDQTAASSHVIRLTLKNVGAGAGNVGFRTTYVLKRVGTPPLPVTKIVRCKYCGHQWEVPTETTSITCPKCSELLIFFDLSSYRA